MGLKSVFKSVAQTAFDVFDDIAVTATFSHVSGSPVYNPTTGIATAATVDSTIKVILDNYGAKDVDGVNILQTDMTAMVPVENISVTPSVHDFFTIGSERWNIIDKKTDAAEAIWLLQVRKP